MSSDRHVVVVGGGITGLAAAWELTRSADPPRVTVREAGERLGGKLQASAFAGIPDVDEGADAFLARVPEASALCDELGLTDRVSPATGTAFVWSGGRLHPIPDGLVLGVPAGLAGLVRSRLLSPRGVLRAGLDVVRPRTPPTHDNLGRLIRDRFGAEVLERLVDPLVGSINAGDSDRLSLEASTPQIAGPATRSRSLLLALRKVRRAMPPAGSTGPVFSVPRTGMASIAATLAARLADEPTVTIRTGAAATTIARDGARWRVDDEPADGVILAIPAPAAAPLVAPLAPAAATALGAIPYAGVVMVTLHVRGDVGPAGSGYLVPKPVQGHVTAVSFASRKWAHWRPDGGGTVLRVSLGRHGHEAALGFGDDEAVAVVADEVGRHLGTALDPVASRVTRWPGAFPQYLPHHLDRVAGIEGTLAAECPGLVVAGAAYRGIGVPACIRQGRDAARRLANSPTR